MELEVGPRADLRGVLQVSGAGDGDIVLAPGARVADGRVIVLEPRLRGDHGDAVHLHLRVRAAVAARCQAHRVATLDLVGVGRALLR